MERQSSIRPEAIGQLSFRFAEGSAFPTRPPARPAEQRVLPVPSTIQAAFESWRQTEAGSRVVAWMEAEVLRLQREGKRRIGMKSVAEDARDELRLELNNSFVSLIAREFVERHPSLRTLIQLRERTST